MISPLYICGPTASGKTSLALALAEQLDGEIINADAFQIYRGLETLSAAPTEKEKAQAPHHLFSIHPLTETMDAAHYHTLAAPLIEKIKNQQKLPIIVGGSGLYLKFLTHGMAQAPTGDEKIRAELETLDLSEIYQRLKTLDPEEAARQNSQNRRHLSRALEICLLTGKKASEVRKNFEVTPSQLNGIALSWPRDELAERISQRTSLILEHGALQEVKNLPPTATTSRQAIGVREIEAHLRGEITYAECQEKITISTRQYAKRQRNWFRRESWLKSIDGTANLEDQVRNVLSNMKSSAS